MLENKVRGNFLCEEQEVTGSWRELHNGQINNLYPFCRIYIGLSKNKWKMYGTCNTHRKMGNAYEIVVSKRETHMPLEVLRGECGYNIAVGSKGVECEVFHLDLTGLG
jgi:hypothetical protein